MCGITGFIRRPGPGAEALRDAVARMGNAIAHRGPDDSGEWVEPSAGVALAFRRLAIIDLTPAGHQPMASASGRYTMVFNGEVFNHHELRAPLLQAGVQFRGHSDTEVLLACFEREGIEAAVTRFVGMFAIAVWDAERRELSLIRDRLGIKPVYVHAQAGYIGFGSELKALVAGPQFDREIDRGAAATYLRYLYVPAPASIFRHTVKLPAGHILTIRDPDAPLPASRAYWSLEQVARRGREDLLEGTDEAVAAEFDRLLDEVVRLRMEADVPLGALLSGGIDSSLVVAVMQAASARPVRTFSIGFDQAEHDESAHARAVASHLGTDHTELRVDGASALRLVDRLPEMFDEPLADPSQIPTYLVCQLARQHVTVALTGDGGDEFFAGYNRYVAGERLMQRAAGLPRLVRQLAASGIQGVAPEDWDRLHGSVAALLPASARTRLPGTKLHKIGRLFREETEVSRYRSLVSAWPNPLDLLRDVTEVPQGPEFWFARSPEIPLLERMMLADQASYLPDDLLAKVDRASMAVSLEARVPLLDHRLVEFSWRLPRRFKLRDGTGKWLLRQALYRRVPRALVDREKQGFSVPLAQWLRGPLRGWAGDQLATGALERRGLFRPAAVQREWQRFLAGSGDAATGLWAVLMLTSWQERWT